MTSSDSCQARLQGSRPRRGHWDCAAGMGSGVHALLPTGQCSTFAGQGLFVPKCSEELPENRTADGQLETRRERTGSLGSRGAEMKQKCSK